MSDVNFSIGGTVAPFQQAMEEVRANAKESASKVSESFGIEGIKGEHAIHTRLAGAFNDVTKSGTNSAEAIGGAFENLTEGLRLSMGSMIALLAVSELVKGLYSGYEAGEKMKETVKDALSINSDVTGQSVEKVAESVKKLKEDADANNLGSISSMTAGATVLIQALEEGKTISETVRDDAENYNRLKQEAHDMEDREGAKSIETANEVLRLKLEGKDKEAEALTEQQRMQDEIIVAQEKGDEVQIQKLQEKIDLTEKLAQKQRDAEAREKEQKLDDLQNQVHQEQLSREGDTGKLQAAHERTERAKSAFGVLDATGTDAVATEKARLDWEKAITAEKEVQKTIDDKKLKAFLDGNEADARAKQKQEEAAKKALELTEQRTKLLGEQKEAQQAVRAAELDSTLFHGDVSSLAKVGLGGRVSGPNYGNQSQLKAAQDAAKHLGEINAAIKKLNGSIGIAQ